MAIIKNVRIKFEEAKRLEEWVKLHGPCFEGGITEAELVHLLIEAGLKNIKIVDGDVFY
jgi:hypothetical protein